MKYGNIIEWSSTVWLSKSMSAMCFFFFCCYRCNSVGFIKLPVTHNLFSILLSKVIWRDSGKYGRPYKYSLLLSRRYSLYRLFFMLVYVTFLRIHVSYCFYNYASSSFLLFRSQYLCITFDVVVVACIKSKWKCEQPKCLHNFTWSAVFPFSFSYVHAVCVCVFFFGPSHTASTSIW